MSQKIQSVSMGVTTLEVEMSHFKVGIATLMSFGSTA